MFDNKTNVEFKAMGNLANGYTVIPNNVMNDMKNMTPDGFCVFGKILQYINSDKNKISVLGLSTLTGLTKGRVSKALNKLIELGYIKRIPKMNGNIINGYVYEIYVERQVNTESLRETVGKSRLDENKDAEMEDIENTDYKKEKEKKEKEKKEKKVVVDGDDKEKLLIDLYKSYKIQPRVMPQMKKLLLTYKDKIELELYEEIFMLASEDSVKSKYKYIKELLETFDKKSIYTLEAYNLDCKSYKEAKNVNTKATTNKSFKNENNEPKVKTRFHNVKQTFSEYTPEELKEIIKESQKRKFKRDN